MEKNRLNHTGWLIWLVLGILLAMYFLPDLTLCGHPLRRVNLLSDVRIEPDSAETDSLILPPPPKPAFTDTCPTGMTCIEDYSDSTGHGMKAFYEALNASRTSGRPVRIAYFGDSFIEGDILTADLRALLQQHYGGCGTGFVPITSPVNGFRPTVRHTFGGWQSHCIMDSTYFDRSRQGLSGHYFVPGPGAYVELKGDAHYAEQLDTCRQAAIYFLNKGKLTLRALVNRHDTVTRTFQPTSSLQQMTVRGRIASVRWSVLQADSTLFYGVTMDGDGGISVDNYSLRGSSGLLLRTIPMPMLQQANRQRPYDLIILHYGLNVATRFGKDYDGYAAGMRQSLQHLKQAFPQASILVVSVSDRDYKTEEGELRTMPGVKNLVRYQQHLAADEAVAFWNLFEAMGGECSMAGLVHAQPAMANHDYTHINFRGGRQLAGLLYETLVYGQENYERRKAYETE